MINIILSSPGKDKKKLRFITMSKSVMSSNRKKDRPHGTEIHTADPSDHSKSIFCFPSEV